MSADTRRPPPRTGLAAPLRHREFRWLAAGRVATYLGNAVAPVGLAFAVLDLTGSLVDLGIVIGARSAAMVVLTLFGGVLADRLPRPVILQGAGATAAVSQAAIAVSVLSGFASVPLLVALNVVNGAVAAASLPAALALTPQTVPSGLLRQANAVARMGSNTGMVAGAPLGGLLAALAGPGWALASASAAFALAALCYHRMRLRNRASGSGPRPAGPLADLREGWREFTSRSWLWVVVLQFMVVNAVVTGCVQVLGPGIADVSFGRTAWGFVLAAETLGAFLGGVLASRWQPRRALCFGVAATVVEALPLSAMAGIREAGLLIAAMFVTGVAMEQFAIAWDVSLQHHVPEDRLAKVYSYDVIGSLVAVPVGETMAGTVAAALGVPVTLCLGAALVVIVTAAALANRGVRTLAQGEPLPAAAEP
ncbi:MFS transporter [Amycolatopsis cynarae]|uniref:MFS transporter n=1 Tax=Amycolatopsis cynarae TaxID=2995223 RepID=A0ABY7B9M1_9PSEU|nr:MFS transporter [Amycolatopsis sp. HUAS 11-8]WAL69041.1 MFS transporter [Amycolatopsis sp. HUAS 11-8]